MIRAVMNRRSALAGGSLLAFATQAVLPQAAAAQTAGGAVTVTEDATTFTLSNGIVTAKVSKRNSDLISLVYKGTEVLFSEPSGHPFGYWSHDVTRGVRIETKITIDPASNGGQRAEVSVKGYSDGTKKLDAGLRAAAGGDVYADIEMHYWHGRV